MALPEAKWNCKAQWGYLRESNEAKQNAVMCWAVLGAQRWTLNAVCAIWGNIEAESGFNPWRWQGENVQSTNSPMIGYPGGPNTIGYGLFQFDPAGKYIRGGGNEYPGFGPNYSDRQGSLYDGTAQLLFVDDNATDPNVGYIPTASYPISFADFKVSTANPGDLAKAWLLNFERPADQSSGVQDYRASLALWWWDFLSQGQPIVPGEPIIPPAPPPLPPQPWDTKKSKFIFYLKPHWKRGL